MTDAEQPAQDPGPPILRVVRGIPTDDELAALVAVVAALGSGGAAPPDVRRSEWSAPSRQVRRAHDHGLGAWRAHALPR